MDRSLKKVVIDAGRRGVGETPKRANDYKCS